ncbi:MAG TPA: ABC transporter ATP-binding protein [Thermoplasmata archaeon]|nr:ABC transporter ATP-binding protein [Thermoplasmata archaeon]
MDPISVARMVVIPSGARTPSGAREVLGETSGSMLQVDCISKSFGEVRALSSVSFSVAAGEIVGLLGPNGAGKTTTMRAVLGLIPADSGEIRLFGRNVNFDPEEAKRISGYVPESPALYEFLTAAEYLDFVADMYGLDRATRSERIRQYLSAFELAGHENSLISGYSQGMKQKVAVIAALCHHPKLLILDEPLNGLDPRSARITKDLLRSLTSHERVAILFSTHVLEIAQAICDRIVILDRGRVLASGTVAAIRERAGLTGRDLEEVFLELTGTGDLRDIVDALSR